ncbi:hypothetical protein VNO77_34162 [Canavalia gladiata]|uniref:Uncharacterized protein n=1 Tax=Canavalia gladiata TaxID=3824 RepID=A0AAN9KF41_CANGL
MAYHQSFPVINRYYCAPNYVNLRINTDNGFTYDINGNPVFHIRDTLFTLHNRRVLCDSQGNPIVTLCKKNMTLHGRCQVFRGKSNDSSELLFSVKRSSVIQDSELIKLQVFLAGNKTENVCDFRVDIYSGKSSCYVYAGESLRIVSTV